MHEASLMNDLISKIEAILDEQDAERVVSVSVTLGVLSHMSPDHFSDHFESAAIGKRMEGARLDIDLMDDIHHPMAQDILLDSIEVE